MTIIVLTAAALSIVGSAFCGPIRKIGVRNDRNGAFADLGRAGTVLATRSAVADFGNSILVGRSSDAEKIRPTISGKVSVRKDGRVLYDLNLFVVKASAESTFPWDVF
jgi:hypothetical protein